MKIGRASARPWQVRTIPQGDDIIITDAHNQPIIRVRKDGCGNEGILRDTASLIVEAVNGFEDIPSYKDVPDKPGWWVANGVFGKPSVTVVDIRDGVPVFDSPWEPLIQGIRIHQREGLRWYGPIPLDKESGE